MPRRQHRAVRAGGGVPGRRRRRCGGLRSAPGGRDRPDGAGVDRRRAIRVGGVARRAALRPRAASALLRSPGRPAAAAAGRAAPPGPAGRAGSRRRADLRRLAGRMGHGLRRVAGARVAVGGRGDRDRGPRGTSRRVPAGDRVPGGRAGGAPEAEVAEEHPRAALEPQPTPAPSAIEQAAALELPEVAVAATARHRVDPLAPARRSRLRLRPGDEAGATIEVRDRPPADRALPSRPRGEGASAGR